MNEANFTENSYEQALIELFKGLGYEYVYGPNVIRSDVRQPLMVEVLSAQVRALNRDKSQEAIDEALRIVNTFDEGILEESNERFTEMLQMGVPVKFVDEKGEEKNDIIRLVDFEAPTNNRLQIVNQWTILENAERRMDLVVMVNGLPLVVMELKSPSREETNVHDAYLQMRNYMQDVPRLFHYNQLCVISDMLTTRVGTLTSPENRYMEWKSKDGNYASTTFADYETFFVGIFEPSRFLNILRHFIFYMDTGGSRTVKILAGYHQYFAVNKALVKTMNALEAQDGKIGVFWHTQGSGKSLSMVFYAHQLIEHFRSSTILVLTDRVDLDMQLFTTFSHCSNYLRQTPIRAYSRDNLYHLLENRQSDGIIFANIQKFKQTDEPISTRADIIVMTDEAHRSQYGMEEKVDAETGRIRVGTARIIRTALPNASFIGFTGTPISDKDRDTQEVFGDYIDVYDMTQAVDDGATVPVYYESRVLNLNLDDDTKRRLDEEYERLSLEGADDDTLEKSKRELAHMDSILGADATIHSLCADIIKHYEENRQFELTGKAMIVAYSRKIGLDIYKKILELRPEWTDKIGVVMSTSNQDPEEWRSLIGNANEMAYRFKNNKDSLKIVIVKDMWLTGFDVPSLATMYVFKPMRGHNLMQAIARVNRVFPEKSGGLVVDYVGIASALKKAMHDYTGRDRKRFGNPDIKRTAYHEFCEHLEICQDILHGYDYEKFRIGTDLERANLIKGGVNFLLLPERDLMLKDFMKHAALVKSAVTLCRSILREDERFEAAYMEAVRTLLLRVKESKGISKIEVNERINELLKQSVKSDGVINLFDSKSEGFSLFDEDFLKEVAQMKEKNIAIELLRGLLKERVREYQKKNLVQSQKFSEMLEASLGKYLRGLLTNEEVIQELLKMAHEISDHRNAGDALGLSEEEMAFYDALTQPEAVKDFYENDQLVAMTKELTEQLRANRTLDWREKTSAQAKMRTLIKRLLKKYNYPPEKAKDALEIVMKQCEQWAENVA